jgi:uncharacterized lipoprotein YmbA
MIGRTSRLLILLIVGGCATSEPLPEFYTLGPGGDIHSKIKQSAARSVRVYVNRVILPAYLNRTNLASFRNNQVEYSSYAFWAAPLDQSITQCGGYDSGEVVLSGVWELRSPDSSIIKSKPFAIHRSGWRPGHYSSLAMLLADEVTELSKQIASVLDR